ncbi:MULTISPECIES: DUF4180 domain-containing protein [unclassified Serratia (in: enterobacteria)]|uniref:DUF4180 domain-containing protein n=1 Tax=unclassified Serratia (in: enterobacteria) TaxID=2647522 RepID=UPI001E5E8496|nr:MULTISPECIES: DUF4180 domain-containing protein [unclassified Serratia (in: enterobacteria)]
MSYAVRQIHDLRLVVFAEAGPLLKDENDVSLFIAPAFEHDAGMIALPVTASTPPSSNSEAAWRPRHIAEIHQLPPARGAAGRYHPPRPAQSNALQDFVREANRGEQVWFLSSLAELEQRLGA